MDVCDDANDNVLPMEWRGLVAAAAAAAVAGVAASWDVAEGMPTLRAVDNGSTAGTVPWLRGPLGEVQQHHSER